MKSTNLKTHKNDGIQDIPSRSSVIPKMKAPNTELCGGMWHHYDVYIRVDCLNELKSKCRGEWNEEIDDIRDRDTIKKSCRFLNIYGKQLLWSSIFWNNIMFCSLSFPMFILFGSCEVSGNFACWLRLLHCRMACHLLSNCTHDWNEIIIVARGIHWT